MNPINENIFFDKRNGKYIEVGAGNGIATEYFEKELDWTGMLIEPNFILASKLEEDRPNSIVYGYPIITIPQVYFHTYYEDSANMSAIEETVPDDIAVVYYNDEIILNERKTIDLLETKTLTSLIKEPYDFMIIDVNGSQISSVINGDVKGRPRSVNG